MTLPLALYILLLAIAIFAPLRWGLAAYLVLSSVDFYAGGGNIGILNAVKGIAYPIYVIWRLKQYAGHKSTLLAPIAWLLFVVYVAIASAWSIFPLSAVKMVGELAGSFLICIAFLRATKAGFLTPAIVVPVTIGVLIIGVIRTATDPFYGGEVGRFSGFTTAQAYASLLVSLFALALCAKSLAAGIRAAVCIVLAIAVVLDGSRIWTLGLIACGMVAILISHSRAWIKIFSVAAIVLLLVGLVAEKDTFLTMVSRYARNNRVADTISALYSGNERSTGLGTFKFRRGVYQRAVDSIAASSVTELILGHGTSNGRILRGGMNQGIGDPNRAVHNEWLRIFYEWGIIGSVLWLFFIGSIIIYAVKGTRQVSGWYASPLLAYTPAFLAGLSAENILAGAGHAENIGFVLLIAIASIAYRQRIQYLPVRIVAGSTDAGSGREPRENLAASWQPIA